MVRMSQSGATARLPAPAQVLETAETAFLWFDAETRLAWLNPAAEDLLEVSLLGSEPPIAARLFPVCRELVEAIARVDPEADRISLRDYALVVARDRPVGRVDCLLAPLAGGTLLEMVAREGPARMQDEADREARLDAARRLVHKLAHEIRNPLAGMRGAAQLLERQLSDRELHDYTGVILTEADRLGALVSRMFGPDSIHPRATNIHAPLEHVRQLLQAEASERIEVERDYDPSLPEVQADPDLLIQVFLNLGRNALQALGGQGRLCLRTRILRQATISGRRLRLAAAVEIEDDGTGIPPELQATLFYPMVSGREQGQGLGLAIANELVARHQGALRWESRPGRTCFQVILPLEAQ